MYDGTFADSASTPIGNVHWGKSRNNRKIYLFLKYFISKLIDHQIKIDQVDLSISGGDIAYCLMMDDSGVVQQCSGNKATLLCEMHLQPIDKQLCLDKTIASSSITFNASTEIVIPSSSVSKYFKMTFVLKDM